MYFLSVSHVAWFNATMWALAWLHRSESTIAYTLNSAEAAGMLYVLTAEWSPLRDVDAVWHRTQGGTGLSRCLHPYTTSCADQFSKMF